MRYVFHLPYVVLIPVLVVSIVRVCAPAGRPLPTADGNSLACVLDENAVKNVT